MPAVDWRQAVAALTSINPAAHPSRPGIVSEAQSHPSSIAPCGIPAHLANVRPTQKCRSVRFRAAVGVIADVTQTSFEDRC